MSIGSAVIQNRKVSIVTATFNSVDYIKETYASLAAQSYENWEWLVTDDASDDGTWELLQKFASRDSRIKLSRLDVNSGAAIARNSSLDRIAGDFISFIDSDDLWDSDKLAEQVGFMAGGKQFSFTGYRVIDVEGKDTGAVVDFGGGNLYSYEDMLFKRATMGCSTVMLATDFVGETRMPLIRTGQDYAFWLKLLKKCDGAYLMPEVKASYRIVPGSISRNKLKKAKRQWQIYRELENLSLTKALLCFISYAWRALTR